MRAFIAVGTNLGDRWAHLARAARGLAAAPRTALVAASRVFESAPLGPPQPRYLNAVLEVETSLTPQALLHVTQGLEARAHRRRDLRWGPRTLDLDLLLFGDLEIQERRLALPHPRIASRRFVLAPLAQLAPDRVVPGTGRTVADLLAAVEPWDLAEVGLYPRP
jgi:2-amino-4-hydroxy-6-hydroxymethyldihydropteridine diphosphokinase